jgi:hypothetical protein
VPPLAAKPPHQWPRPLARAQELELRGAAVDLLGQLAAPASAGARSPRLRALTAEAWDAHRPGGGGAAAAAAARGFLSSPALASAERVALRLAFPLRVPRLALPLLSELELGSACSDVDEAAAAALAASDLPRLASLAVYGLGPGALAALCAAPWAAGLRKLSLVRPDLRHPLAAEALAAAPLASLESFGLEARAHVHPATAARLVAAPWLRSVRELRLLNLRLGGGEGEGAGGAAGRAAALGRDAGPPPPAGAPLPALCRAPLAALTALRLSHAGLSAGEVAGELAHAPWLPRLADLDLTGNSLCPGACEALASAPLRSLRALSAVGVGLCGGGLAAIGGAPWATQLRRLSVGEAAGRGPCPQVLAAAVARAGPLAPLARAGCDVRFVMP